MPNRIQEAEDALCGSMEMQAFMALIRRSPALQEALQQFIPPSAICDPSNAFWNNHRNDRTRFLTGNPGCAKIGGRWFIAMLRKMGSLRRHAVWPLGKSLQEVIL